jgi:ribosome recycling factor
MIDDIYQETKETMGKTVEALKIELQRIGRVGASLSILYVICL